MNMRVKHLIEYLQALDPEMIVLVDSIEGEFCDDVINSPEDVLCKVEKRKKTGTSFVRDDDGEQYLVFDIP